MKNKLLSVLVLLVAIAMMIPSFAFAEDAAKTPTFTLTGADTPIEVKMGDAIDTSGITWEVKDLPTGSALQNAEILWTVTSDNNSTFSLSKTKDILTADVSGQAVPTVTNSNFKKNKEDVTDSTATVTGKLVVNSKDIASKSFTVKVSKVDVTSIDFNDTAKQNKTTASAGQPVDLTANGNITLVAPDNASFGINDVVFSVVSGGEYANITSTGSLYINSNTPNDTKIKVRAYIPGSKVAGYKASKAEIEITVVGQYKPDDPQVAANDAYTFIGFTVDKDTGNVYTIHSYPVFSFNAYLTALGNNGTGTDKLAWEVDDPTKATLAKKFTSDADNTLTFKKTDVAAKVKVTVKSQNDPTVTDYCYVQFVPAEENEDKGYTKIAFQPYTEITVVGDTFIDVNNYLVTEIDATSNDHLVYESSDTSIASVNTAGVITRKVAEGEVTIHVFSYLNPAIGADLKIKFVKAAEDSKYESLTFSKSTFEFKINENDYNVSFNANDYLTTVPAQAPAGESLTWTSNNTNVATVAGGYVTLKPQAGTATIKVENKDKSAFAAITVKVEVVENPYKAITVSAEAQKGLTVEEGKTIKLRDYLTLELTRANAATTDKLVFVVDNAKTATVTTAGRLEGVKASDKPVTVTVRNTTGSVKAEIKVTVEKPKTVSYTSLKFDTAELTVPKNFPAIDVEARHLIAVEPDDITDKTLIWKSSNEKVAYFANSAVGTLTIAKPGTTEISVCNGYNTVKSENVLKITVVDAEPFTEVTAIESAKTVYTTISKTCVLTNLVHTEGGYNDSLIWTSDNQQIALVSNNGVVTVQDGAENGDTVKITARSKWDKSKTATITLTIDTNQIAIKSITLTQDTFELEPKGSLYLDRYVVTDPVEHNDTLFYTSDDPSVAIQNNTASVDANLLEDGEAHITVRSTLNPDVSAKFTLKLKGKGVTSIAFKDAPKTFYKEMNTLNLWDYLVTKPADYVEKHSGNLVWESSDPTVALAYNEQPRVDIPGEIIVYGCLTYVQPGNVTITVTDKVSGKSAKVDLVLKEKHPVESIELKDVTLDVDDFAGLYDFLSFKPLDANFDESKLTFTSSNREVAEVIDPDPENEDIAVKQLRDKTRGPLLVAYKAGTTKITAYYELDDKTILKDTCVVTVEEVELDKVKISQDKYTLKLNTKMDAVVRFNVEPFNCTFEKEDLYVISADPEIVEVSEIKVDTESHKGKFTITGKKPGTAWVVVKRAKDDKALDACKVKVKAVAVKSVGWEKKNVKMYYYDDGREDPDTVIKVVQAPNTVYKNLLKVKPIINPSKAYCNVSFETSDPSVAFINDNKVVDFLNGETPYVDLICMGPGKCKITMKVDDGKKVRKAVMNVEVLTKLPKMKMSQSKATLKLEKGKDTLQLRAYDANTDTDLEVKWTSSNKKVVKVNAEGKVRAIAAGTATITATTKNGEKQVVKCKITVKAPSTKNDAAKKITGDTKVTVKAGEKKALEIKVKPEGAKVTFTSSDSKIVKVTKDGTIKGIKAGKATITVKAAEGKAELKIKVVVK